jgi:hypothetical protein
MIPGSDAPGRYALGQITDGSWQTAPALQWQAPIRKTGLAIAVVVTTFAGFVPPPAARAVVPVVQDGGTSRKLDVPEPEAPRRKKKTGFEPVKKVATQPLIEPRKPAFPLPPFEIALPFLTDDRSPLDIVNRDLVPENLLGLQEQIASAHQAYLDAQDIADVLRYLGESDD